MADAPQDQPLAFDREDEIRVNCLLLEEESKSSITNCKAIFLDAAKAAPLTTARKLIFPWDSNSKKYSEASIHSDFRPHSLDISDIDKVLASMQEISNYDPIGISSLSKKRLVTMIFI
jgi:hypothetical protein